MWSNYQLLRQSSGGHGHWSMLPPPLSSWKLMPWSHLALQWSPTLNCLRWLSHQCTHYEVLRFAVILNENLGLRENGILFCLLAILDSAIPDFLAGVVDRGAGIGLRPFPTPLFAWALSAGTLAVLSPLLDPPRLAPSHSAFLCTFHGYTQWIVGIFCSTEVCFDLLHFLSGLHWWEV